MRTDTPTPRAPTVDRMRAEFARARRRFKAQPPALRWSLGLALAAALVALSYASTGTTAPAGSFVRSGERFAADDKITVCNALDRLHIRYHVDDQNRIEVAAAQLDAANDAVAKLSVGPRSIADIDQGLSNPSLWDSPSTALLRQDRATCAKLEEMIRPIDGVVSAHVILNRPRGPRGFRPAPAATAFVMLETDRDRELCSATVESIQGLIAGAVPEIKHDAVTVFDRKGRHYLDASNGAVGAEVKNRHRRDQLRQEIVDKLEWLKGAVVSVQLVPAPAVPVPPPPALPPLPATTTVAATPTPAPAPEAAPPPLSMRVNEPLELTQEVPEPPVAVAAPAPVPTPVPAPAPAVVSAPPPPPQPPPRARVWVKVPRSFYLRAVPDRDPSLDDLQPLVERTKGLIETAVRHVVPPGQLDEPVVISTIPDDSPTPRPASASVSASSAQAEARRLVEWWVPAGAALALAALAGGLTVAFVMAARRPALRPAGPPRDGHGTYKIDDASDPGPGPSERVRELIRLNPEAAASVLHRWTGQGGTLG